MKKVSKQQHEEQKKNGFWLKQHTKNRNKINTEKN
jgi:hypothetical protein